MNLKLERRRGGFGKAAKSAIEFVTVRLDVREIELTPWECFTIIDREARRRGLRSADLGLVNARPFGNSWHLVFEVGS